MCGLPARVIDVLTDTPCFCFSGNVSPLRWGLGVLVESVKAPLPKK